VKSNIFTSHNVLTPEECQTIINYCSNKCKPSNTLDINDRENIDKKWRNSVNTFLNDQDFKKLPMINKIIDHVVEVSNEFFRFPIGFVEDIQYADYEKGMYYKEHIDSGSTEKSDRDISASVILTPRNEYVGGNLCFRRSPNSYLDVDEQQGSVIVFSSLLVHKVKKVEKGKRSSLTLWCKRHESLVSTVYKALK